MVITIHLLYIYILLILWPMIGQWPIMPNIKTQLANWPLAITLLINKLYKLDFEN